MRVAIMSLLAAAPLFGADVPLFIGTYTTQGSQGIYAARLNLETGALSAPELAAETANPTFLALHPSGKYLYTVSEIATFKGEKAGAVSAYAIDPKTAKLTFINQVSSHGAGPCHVSVDRTGETLMVANYGGGSVAAFTIGGDGRVHESTSFHQHFGKGGDPKRQERAHAHSIFPSPGNRFAIAADLGVDRIYLYRLNAHSGTISPHVPESVATAAGAGPRHFAFHPNGRNGYAVNELDNTVTAYEWDESTGALTPKGSVGTLPAGFSGTSHTAEILVHPSGKFLYASNRGHDSIAVFNLDNPAAPAPVQHMSTGGVQPRNFTLDKSGKWLLAANQRTGNVAVFRVDAATGRLTDTGNRIEVGAPVCLRILE
jgi:6-phosphogluconolactonase